MVPSETARTEEAPLSRVALFVTFEVRPERRDDFVAHLRAHAADTLRNVDGCLQFEVLVPMEAQFDAADRRADPDHVYLYELYTDNDAFLTHVTSKRVKRTRSGYADMILNRKIVRCEVQ